MRRLGMLCVCLAMVSCADKYGGHPPYPTSGQILVNGQPAAEAKVVFHHLGDWGERSIVPQALTDDEGRFVLSTYDVQDGAPAGDYRVVVEWPAYRKGRNIGPDLLGGKFARADISGLTAHVEPGNNELPPIEIKAQLTKAKEEPARRARRRELRTGGKP
jgi:hypothetical protein